MDKVSPLRGQGPVHGLVRHDHRRLVKRLQLLHGEVQPLLLLLLILLYCLYDLYHYHYYYIIIIIITSITLITMGRSNLSRSASLRGAAANSSTQTSPTEHIQGTSFSGVPYFDK